MVLHPSMAGAPRRRARDTFEHDSHAETGGPCTEVTLSPDTSATSPEHGIPGGSIPSMAEGWT